MPGDRERRRSRRLRSTFAPVDVLPGLTAKSPTHGGSLIVCRAAGFLAAAGLFVAGASAAALTLIVDAPPSLSGAVERIRRADMDQLAARLSAAGLELPARVRVTLIAEDDPQAHATPVWIVGRAFSPEDVVIFPERAATYPYDSLEAIVRHEVVHLALSARAGGRAIPRWFHEGVAVALETGWGLTGELRLLLALSGQPAITEVTRLFESDREPEAARAYLLAAALVDDLRQRHGAAIPGAIAERVQDGVPFERAFHLEIGETVDQATTRAWGAYLRWTSWIPFLTSPSAVWGVILALASVAFAMQLRRRARRRRQWDEEGGWP